MVVTVKDFTKGKTAVSYDDGKKCFDWMKSAMDQEEEIILDFEGIEYAITAFLNPIIGDLILQKGNACMDRISIRNANQIIIDRIRIVKDGALLRREDIKDGVS